MPFLGIGLHVLVAIFFAIHAIRTGRQLYWLLILFSFPILGSVVYFFAEYLPSSRLEQGLRSVGSTAARTLDPGRELREARHAFDLTPTAQNQIRLADALLAAGQTAEAVAQFDQCLSGPFAKDLHIRTEAARAKLAHQQAQAALDLLKSIRQDDPKYRLEDIAILFARAYAALGQQAEAKTEFEYAVSNHGNIESRVEYAIWAANVGDLTTAKRLQQELEKDWQHWPKHARQLNKPLIKKVDAAIFAASK